MEKLLKKILTVIKKKPDSSQAYEDLYYMCEEAMKTDEALAVKYLKLLSQVIENRIPKTKEDKMLRFLFGLHKRSCSPSHRLTLIPICFTSNGTESLRRSFILHGDLY